MNEISELKRQGLSIRAISALTGFDTKTVRKYLRAPKVPRYGPRPRRPSLLDAHKPYIAERLQAGVWNVVVLLRELQERGYPGGYTVLREYVKPLREQAHAAAVRRFETPPGQQAQVDWGAVGDLTLEDGTTLTLSCFVMTLGHSRAAFVDITTDRKLPTFLRLHEAAFAYLGGVPKELLYDWMKTVASGTDERGEVKWQPTFEDFAGYWGFVPRLCRPYRPQTKGKVESGVGYVKKNFLCGRQAADLQDLRRQLRGWLEEVANARVHGTTHRVVRHAWEEERPHLRQVQGRPPYPLLEEHVRRVTRDGFVCLGTNRYAVNWELAGKEVLVRVVAGQLEVWREGCRSVTHPLCQGRYQTIHRPELHAGIPTADTAARRNGKARLTLRVSAPEVQVRSLAVYSAFAEPAAAQAANAQAPDAQAEREDAA